MTQLYNQCFSKQRPRDHFSKVQIRIQIQNIQVSKPYLFSEYSIQQKGQLGFKILGTKHIKRIWSVDYSLGRQDDNGPFIKGGQPALWSFWEQKITRQKNKKINFKIYKFLKSLFFSTFFTILAVALFSNFFISGRKSKPEVDRM